MIVISFFLIQHSGLNVEIEVEVDIRICNPHGPEFQIGIVGDALQDSTTIMFWLDGGSRLTGVFQRRASFWGRGEGLERMAERSFGGNGGG